MAETGIKVRAAGAGLVLVILAAFLLTGALYTHAFSDPAEVTVRTARAGLVMDPGNKVKMRGIEIGTVGDVRSTDSGAELILEIDRDQLDRIPADVEARIRATTVFGAKFVELVAPAQATSARLASGAVLDATGVTTEINTVLKGLDRLLTGIDAADLNSTLTVLSRTLSGRGDDIATIAADADAYLTRLEPLLPALRRDLVEVARFARLGNEISPALLRILENASVTSTSVVDEQRALNQVLVDLSILGGDGARVLGVNGAALASLLANLRPTASTLRAYSSELPCLLLGLDETRKIMADVIGGTSAGLRARLTFRSELAPYTVPKDLPTDPVGRGPGCEGLPRLSADQIPTPERGVPE